MVFLKHFFVSSISGGSEFPTETCRILFPVRSLNDALQDSPTANTTNLCFSTELHERCPIAVFL